ncbi:MFS transporter [Modicisalibacter xianhensis]|uniref:Predicted arabinose efflux permease, MFS family n=1 Tax=Modicisalibacter xianhensis TaxID=442341 RepID=A0A1I3CRU2_9GAMM|nr:MFS transporter [Halomonas xianhensis]SFH77235.1 Predicted arabinose efflux permease, MFS family [Halomonas xianhensis]
MTIFLIAVAELFGTALWFTPNAVIGALQQAWGLAATDLGWLTGAVQAGFLLGTLGIGLSGLADRLDASRLFAGACLVGAASNALLPLAGGFWPAVFLRLITGMTLAGIYPIGMKLMVGWAPGRTGLGLAWLVGMLVLGTALPHALHGISMAGMFDLPWASGIWGASLLAMLAGLLIWRLGEAPQVRASKRRATAARAGLDFGVFTIPGYRRAAGGYFGHMWELYTLWALLPLLLASAVPQASPVTLALGSFALIAIGGPGCWLGGWLSQRIGSRHVAMLGLAGSGTCCLIYPWMTALPAGATLVFLGLWSALAVVDSAHFSALSARAVPTQRLGTALTLQNAIGFGISVLSLVLLVPVWPLLEHWVAWLLLPGPLAGLWLIRQPITDMPEAA